MSSNGAPSSSSARKLIRIAVLASAIAPAAAAAARRAQDSAQDGESKLLLLRNRLLQDDTSVPTPVASPNASPDDGAGDDTPQPTSTPSPVASDASPTTPAPVPTPAFPPFDPSSTATTASTTAAAGIPDSAMNVNNYCGLTWTDAYNVCHKPCSTGSDDECTMLGDDYKCQSFTLCHERIESGEVVPPVPAGVPAVSSIFHLLAFVLFLVHVTCLADFFSTNI